MIAREYTNRILDAIDNGYLNPKDVVDMCLQWMSEAEVKQMCQSNDICCSEEEEYDCDDSDDRYALASAGFGTDEDY